MFDKTIILVLFLFVGCSLTSITNRFSERKGETQFQRQDNHDLVVHLESIGDDYIKSPSTNIFKISLETQNYLAKLHKRLTQNNELLFDQKIVPKFYIVMDASPFYFSLPNGRYFFSVGLIKKYLKHEEYLVTILTKEMLKSHQNLYIKNAIVPVGYIGTERVISLTRVPSESNIQINKWTYFAMKRAGYDGYVCLIWLQTMNRNALEFSQIAGDAHAISSEELAFKNFIVAEGIVDRGSRGNESNSSKGFYEFINEVQRVKI